MADESKNGTEITLERMMTLRAATEAVSGWVRKEAEDRLACLRPLLLPRRLLGDHVKSPVHDDVKDADKAFAELQSAYREVAGTPFKLPGRLDSPVDPISTDLVLHRWEYTHEARDEGDSRSLSVKSPLSWILMHEAPISLSQARQMLAGGAGRSDADLKQFAVNALVMKQILDRSPALIRLLDALRLKVAITESPETGKLPLVKLTSPIPTFRPSDHVILGATRLSGIPIFEELLDVDAARSLPDAYRDRMLELIGPSVLAG
jgi:hypothetical protein